ncbi:hypothetical protein [Azospirillum halopraeferens]|uniref:hypothetical protein n=1 Tax=Azospirillum halopraeferens TaxID=34010 RepID=UPI00041BB5E9|nr:hypothetical protein [Azospirillum halopraeferens]
MRILVAIPHYVRPGSGYYGSTAAGTDGTERGAALQETIAALHRCLGPRQSLLLNRRANVRIRTNRADDSVLDVVVVTTGEHHDLARLRLPPDTWRRRATTVEPLALGFECHAALAEGIGAYDWFAYLEDDLVVEDAAFLVKLAWFLGLVGPEALLLPNRFEVLPDSPEKLYIDGHVDPAFAGRWQDVRDRSRLTGRVMGAPVTLWRPNNPHAGCFILSEAQMRRWAEQPHFLDRDTSFAGPLESAATLGMLKTFRIYKPAPDSAGFLEIRHRNNRYLGNWLARPDAVREPTWVGRR